MCGIAGFLTPGRPADVALLQRMCDAMRHRGPDDEGQYVSGPLAIGMRRLSVIDIATGQQPMSNVTGTVWVVFNGEIYNFPDLRRQLQRLGHAFRTAGDTECLIHLYEEYGDDCVDHLRGMFAFALWDAAQQRLLLARDRVGKKPLYYRLCGGGIWFGSELKSLVQDPTFPRRVDPIALHHYLSYHYVPAPWSIYEGVSKLPPASVLVFSAGSARLRKYWHLRYNPKATLSDADAVAAVRSAVLEATRIRLVSERPIGAFLSGGVDSSLVVAAMAAQSTDPVKTFTVGFDDGAFDERHYAAEVAARLGTEHHEYLVRPDVIDVLPTLAWHHDEPFADSSAIPSFYLARMTKDHVTVALTGDGGDESFGGYERYEANLMSARLRPPDWAQRPLRPLRRRLLRSSTRWPASRRARRLAALALTAPSERYAASMCAFGKDDKLALCSPALRNAVSGSDSSVLLSEAFFGNDAGDPTDRMLAADVAMYLPGDLLTKVDVATMSNSLEARSPLLDHHLMELAARLPSAMKIRGRRRKWVLKEAAKQWLPAHLIDRRKQGFAVPLADWLRGDLRDAAHDVLVDATARGRGYFDPRAVRSLLAEHDAGSNQSMQIWTLMQFELWHRMFLDEAACLAPRRPAAPPLRDVVPDSRRAAPSSAGGVC